MITRFKNSSATGWNTTTDTSWKTSSTTAKLFSSFEEVYSLRLGTSYDEVYGLRIGITYDEPILYSFLVGTDYEELYGLRLGKVSVEPYSDVPVITAVYNEYYGDAYLILNSYQELYGTTLTKTRSISEPYTLPPGLSSVFEEPYAITQNYLRVSYDEVYDVESNNRVLKRYDEPYYLLSQDSSVVNLDVELRINGIPSDFMSFSLSAGMDQYCITCDLEVPEETYFRAMHMAEVELVIDTNVFKFFVENRDKALSTGGLSYSIGLISPAAKLDSPYADTILDGLNDGVYAKSLVESMAAVEGLSVDWQVIDWFIPGSAISINDETPLEVIRRVVNAIGAVVQSKPDGNLSIISEYPVRVPDWPVTTPAVYWSVEDSLNSVSEELEVREGYNACIVFDESSSSDRITLEEVTVNSTTKIIRGYRVPFDDGPFELRTSGGPAVSIQRRMMPVEMEIPVVENDGDDYWEIVEFIDWTGSVSKPIYEVLGWDWIEDDLGEFSFTEDGTLTIIDQSSVPSESLLRIRYKTKFWEWTVHGPTDKPVQFYVPELEFDLDGS